MCMFSLSNEKGEKKKRHETKRNGMKEEMNGGRNAPGLQNIYNTPPHIQVYDIHEPHTHSHNLHARTLSTIVWRACVCININILVVLTVFVLPESIFEILDELKDTNQQRGCERKQRKHNNNNNTNTIIFISHSLGAFNVRFFVTCLLFSFYFVCLLIAMCATQKTHATPTTGIHLSSANDSNDNSDDGFTSIIMNETKQDKTRQHTKLIVPLDFGSSFIY